MLWPLEKRDVPVAVRQRKRQWLGSRGWTAHWYSRPNSSRR